MSVEMVMFFQIWSCFLVSGFMLSVLGFFGGEYSRGKIRRIFEHVAEVGLFMLKTWFLSVFVFLLFVIWGYK